MTEPIIVRVAIENITPLWPQVAPLLQEPIENVGTHAPEDVRKMLMANTAHLWVQWAGSVEAAVVTEFVSYPKGLWLRLWLAGAKHGCPLQLEEFERLIKQWGQTTGCKGLELAGRMGWLRKFPQARLAGVLMRISL